MRVTVSVLALALLAPIAVGTDLRAPGGGPPQAAASVSILLSLDALVKQSEAVVVATAAEQTSRWEELAGGKRIVTYTRLVVDSAVVGEPGKALWVRTLGGVVGDIGQAVSGEAKIAPGSSALVFLAKPSGVFVVAGMAQGHFPIARDPDGTRRLTPSPDAGTLLRRKDAALSARDVLVGLTVEKAAETVRQTRRAQDAQRK